jgi:hypothetical protein
MSTVPLASVAQPSLADAVDESLAAALAGRDEPCLWCGGRCVRVLSADLWSGRVTVICPDCGSELSGVVPRELREVPR